ncbi:hypothetical protein Tco_1553465 [Tanacetum coccineum]
MYDISATYSISHWWFKRQTFYIDNHSAETNRRAIIRTHMRILSVVKIEVFSIYGYDYMKKIVLRRADDQEYTITKNDFKDMYPSNFEDLYLLNLQGHLNHLPPRDKKILSTAVNLWIRNLLNLTKPRWEATGLEFMHDYKILDSLRVVLFRDKYGMQMLTRFNEIHKFSDGTLQQIDEALDYRVKEFKVNKNNLALNTSSGESSGTWKALLVEEYAKETTDFYGEPNDDIFSVASRTSCVSRRDLPRDNSLVSVEVLRYDYKRSNVNKGIVRTEMELVLEHTQQGTSNEVSDYIKMEMQMPRSSKVAFCLLEDLTAFCLKISLHFASRPHCVLLQDIHCVLLEDLTAFCLKTSLRFASRPHCVLLQVITAFCFNITAFCSRPPLCFA